MTPLMRQGFTRLDTTLVLSMVDIFTRHHGVTALDVDREWLEFTAQFCDTILWAQMVRLACATATTVTTEDLTQQSPVRAFSLTQKTGC